jgi:hypothetical protein
MDTRSAGCEAVWDTRLWARAIAAAALRAVAVPVGYPPGDEKPGQVRGQAFLSVWWVVSPTGNAIHKKPRAPRR